MHNSNTMAIANMHFWWWFYFEKMKKKKFGDLFHRFGICSFQRQHNVHKLTDAFELTRSILFFIWLPRVSLWVMKTIPKNNFEKKNPMIMSIFSFFFRKKKHLPVWIFFSLWNEIKPKKHIVSFLMCFSLNCMQFFSILLGKWNVSMRLSANCRLNTQCLLIFTIFSVSSCLHKLLQEDLFDHLSPLSVWNSKQLTIVCNFLLPFL